MNEEEIKEKGKEEYAIILDIVTDSPNSFKNQEIAQAVGTNSYTLLELVPKQGVILRSGQKVYIGDGKRDEIQYIKRALFSSKLSPSSKSELIFAVTEVVCEKEKEFIQFFNSAGPITIRKHSLELISGIGKKHLHDLIYERDSKPFSSFEDIKKRCQFIPEPAKAIAQRIVNEIEGKDDFKFFTRK